MTTELQAETVRARAELAAALDALEDKLNLPKRARAALAQATEWGREHPVALAGVTVGAIAGVVGSVMLAVRVVRR